MNLTALRISIITLIATLLVACGSNKKVVDNPAGQSYTDTPTTTPAPTSSPEIDRLASSYGMWTNVSIPLKIELKKPKGITLSGRAYMVRGKSVMIALKFLGMEVANLYFTNDSVYATEKIHRYLVAEDFRSMMGKYPLTITEVQDMLLGRAFVVGSGTLSANNKNLMKGEQSSQLLKVSPIKAPSGIEYSFEIVPDNNAVRRLTVTAPHLSPISCDYTEPFKSPYGTLEGRLSLSAPMGSQMIDASLIWDLKSATWNSKDIRQWKSPTGYTRLHKSDLLKIFSSF